MKNGTLFHHQFELQRLKMISKFNPFLDNVSHTVLMNFDRYDYEDTDRKDESESREYDKSASYIGNSKSDDSFFKKSLPTGQSNQFYKAPIDQNNVDKLLSKSSSKMKNEIRSYQSESLSSK